MLGTLFSEVLFNLALNTFLKDNYVIPNIIENPFPEMEKLNNKLVNEKATLTNANGLKIKNETNIKTLGNIVPDCWIYVQDASVKLLRIQIFNNWSPYLVKDAENTVWVGLEYTCQENDKYWNMSDEELLDIIKKELLVYDSASNQLFKKQFIFETAFHLAFSFFIEFSITDIFINTKHCQLIDNLI